jgi:hypothetical protein
MTHKSLPETGFTPRGLSRSDAAFYVGVSASTFDEMVEAKTTVHERD